MARQTKTARRRAWREWQWCHDPRCDYCLNEIPRVDRAQVDHIRPLNPTDGTPRGDDHQRNWALACPRCNNKKQNKSLQEIGYTILIRRRTPSACYSLMSIAGKAAQRESVARWRENLKKRSIPCLPT